MHRLVPVALVTAIAAVLFGVGAAPAAPPGGSYTVTPLVSNGGVPAPLTDAHLVNAWGLVAGPMTPWWVSDNGTDLSTLYNSATGTSATKVGLEVSVPSSPTGAVFNGSPSSFIVHSGTSSGSALFLFDTEEGKVLGWSPGVPPPPLSHAAQVGADRSSVGAVYKGLAIAQTTDGPHLYATDFHNGRVDVFNGSFALVNHPGAFVDASLPSDYAPFGIQAIGSRIFVTYAKQEAGSNDEQHGQGLGFVDVYDVDGNLLGRVAQHGQLNAPWGLAWAQASFGRFGGDLLVGNFGDGQINAYEELPNGQFEHRGTLRSTDGGKLAIDGLWALQFGNDRAAGPSGTLFFTAGPNDETDGLFGTITAD
jgi:uncharacterized protein (TIGR03118 family)